MDENLGKTSKLTSEDRTSVFVVDPDIPERVWKQHQIEQLEAVNERLDSGFPLSVQQATFYIDAMHSNSDVNETIFAEKKSDDPNDYEISKLLLERIVQTRLLERDGAKTYSMMGMPAWESTFDVSKNLELNMLKAFQYLLSSRYHSLEVGKNALKDFPEDLDRREKHMESLKITLTTIYKILNKKDDQPT